ncbi:MAG: HupE/UreJ family protein [Rhodopseudomonas sp.]|nr:HupE/UreJ family protein [Rhodopseudomonas sp.]
MALLNKIETAAGERPSRDLDAAALQGKLSAIADVLAHYIEVRFDNAKPARAVSPVKLTIVHVELPPDITKPSYVILTAEGPIPAGASSLTWRYGLVYSTYAVVFADAKGDSPITQWLDSDAESRPFALIGATAPPTAIRIAAQYLELGFRHILPEGLDHILFVLGLFLLSSRLKPILVQVTCFTVAHSVTLGLTMYGLLSLPPQVVEPLIALSIAYVAIENILTPKLTPWRPVVVFGFGLVHGMGFAGALAELNLPRSEILPALVSFNVGIELAQLAVIAAAYFTTTYWIGDRLWYRTRFEIPVCLAIAATGLFWTVERVAGL